MFNIENIKKRYIIAFIITLFILWITKGFWLVQKSKVIFDFYIFTIILVCGYLLSLKLTDFLADFKNVKNQSRIEIVFLAVFFILLFIPMSHINQNEKSEAENRTLASYKPLFENNYKINYQFGNDFNLWFNDRFFSRYSLLYAYNYIKFYINPKGQSEKALIGKNGWLFHKSRISLYQNNEKFTKKELKIIGNNIDKFVSDAKKQGVKEVYFLFSNDKESIYPEFYPSYIKKVGKTSKLNQLLKYMHKNYPEIKVFNFEDKLLDIKKQETIFYKTGTHMNNMGAFYEYTFLINEIKKDYPQLKAVSISDFKIKTSSSIKQDGIDLDSYNCFYVLPKYNKINFKNKILKLKHPEGFFTQVQRPNGWFMTGNNKNAKNDLKLFIIGDSFIGKYYNLLNETFYKTDYVFVGAGKIFILTTNEKEYLKENIPDVLIVSSSEKFIPRFLHLKFPYDMKE